MEVLIEGALEKCVSVDQPKKEWKKRYFVLKHLLASNVRCLEYYKDKNWKKQEPKGVLTLHSGYEVVKVDVPKRKHAFDIRTLEHTFRLNADSEAEFNKWVTILEENNVVRAFNVISQDTLNFQRFGINGPCILRITYTEIQLISCDTRFQVVAWPLKYLRRYSSVGNEFIIEAGRKAPTGEGSFVFHTSESEVIFSLLDNLIRSKAGQTLTPQHSIKEQYNHVQRPTIKQDAVTTSQKLKKVTTQHDSPGNTYDAAYSHLKGGAHTTAPTQPEPGESGSYDTLSFGSKRLSQVSNGSVHSETQEDSYSVLQHEGASKRSSQVSTDSAVDTEDTYDTLVHGTSPAQIQLHGSADVDDGMYNSLSQSAPQSAMKAMVFGEDMYDKINSPATTPTTARSFSPVRPPKSAPVSTEDSYSCLNHEGPMPDLEEYSSLSHGTAQNPPHAQVNPPIPRRRTVSGSKNISIKRPPLMPPPWSGTQQSPVVDDNYDVIRESPVKCPLSASSDETYDVIGDESTLKRVTPLNDDSYGTLTRGEPGSGNADDNYSAINYDAVKPQKPPRYQKQPLAHTKSSPAAPIAPPVPHARNKPGDGGKVGEGVATMQTNMIAQLQKTLESGGLDITKVAGKGKGVQESPKKKPPVPSKR